MPQVSAAVLRSTPSSTSASASIRRAAALFFSPLAALRSSKAVRSSRVIDTAAPIDAAPLKGQHRVRVSLIWESLMSHSFGPLVLESGLKKDGQMKRARFTEEQIIAVLKEHEAGAKTADLARKHGISEATIYNWKAKFGGMDVSAAKRLEALEE